MAESKALSAEIVALFDTIRQQAQAYAEAFSRVEELLQQLQRQREQLLTEVEHFHQQRELLIQQFRRQIEETVSRLTERVAALRDIITRVDQVEEMLRQVVQLPEHFAGQVAEALAQAELKVRSTEQKVALLLRNLQEGLQNVEQRLHVIRLLCQRDVSELRQQIKSLREELDPTQLRQQALQSVELRLQPLEHQVTELATLVVQLERSLTERAPPPEMPVVVAQQEEVVITRLRNELQRVSGRMAHLEKQLLLAFLLFGVILLGALLFLVLKGNP